MPAQVAIKKYTGKDAEFGTLVSSLGIKRVDTCVPSVYSSERLGGRTVPADDGSESQFYCIYRPDDPKCKAYSMECVFKVHLVAPPDRQLTDIRLYPAGPRPRGKHPAVVRIGNSISYSRPTNTRSLIATHDIWEFSREHPFYLTVSGLYGQVPQQRLGHTHYITEYRDVGNGNVVFLDGVRQPVVPVGVYADDTKDIVITFEDRTFLSNSESDRSCLMFIDPETGRDINELAVRSGYDYFYKVVTPESGDGIYPSDGPVVELTVKKAGGCGAWNLMELFPSGIIYQIPPEPECDHHGTGYLVAWMPLYYGEPGWMSTDNGDSELVETAYVPNRWFKRVYTTTDGTVKEQDLPDHFKNKPTEYYEVDVKPGIGGCPVFYLNGVERPQLVFDVHKTYHFFNRHGYRFPMRFTRNMFSPQACVPEEVVSAGIVVLSGNTDMEEIFVNPELVLKSGDRISSYQCVCAPGMGNVVYNAPLSMCGSYNMCRVGGGIYNPLMAGETDYVYMQVEVDGDTDPGSCVPDIRIEYDEI
jgi:hypothetical protein